MHRLRLTSLAATALVLCSLAGVVAAPSAAPAPPAAAPAADPPTYLSLGDSLAAGDQPDAHGNDRPTSAGYADVLGRRLAHVYPGLRTIKHSCAGGTTTSLLHGRGCPALGRGSQVEQAERLLGGGTHAVLVTVNIGDNDVESCVHSDGRGIDAACVARGRARIARNLPVIVARLRAAAPDAAIVGIVDYDQFVAFWLRGAAGRAIARQSVGVIMGLNALITQIYERAGVPVADVSDEFATADLTTRVRDPRVGVVPRAVARICRLTWACTPPPVGFDDHANALGYRVIAQSVLDALADQARRRASGGAQASAARAAGA